MVKKVIWVDLDESTLSKDSFENLLKDNAIIVKIWLADDISKAIGDDWNDNSASCNAGSPYLDSISGLEIIEVRLGKELKRIT